MGASFVLIVTSWLPFSICAIALGVGLVPIPVCIFALSPEVVSPDRVGMGLAILTATSNLGITIGPAGFGSLLDIRSGNIRYALTEPLKNFGGHIGYEIRSSKWGQGYGTVQLKLLLAEAAKLGIKCALLTCSTDNASSIRVIKKNGGVLIDCINNIIDGHERPTYRYKINTGLIDGDLYSIKHPW